MLTRTRSMKSIRTGRIKRHYDGLTYYYYDIATRQQKTLSRDELFEIGRTLPVKVKRVLRKIDLFRVPMTPEEQKDAMLLCSLSISVWKGWPRMSIDGVSMDDYTNDFYMQMVKKLKSWNPEKGAWPSYVKWVRLDTLKEVFKRVDITKKKMAEVRNFRQIDSRAGRGTGLKRPDYRSLQALGLQGAGSRRVEPLLMSDKQFENC